MNVAETSEISIRTKVKMDTNIQRSPLKQKCCPSLKSFKRERPERHLKHYPKAMRFSRGILKPGGIRQREDRWRVHQLSWTGPGLGGRAHSNSEEKMWRRRRRNKHAELLVAQRGMKEGCDEALQRSVKRASIIQQLWNVGQHAEEEVQIRGREEEEEEEMLHSVLWEIKSKRFGA